MSRKSRKPALNVLAHGDGDRPREEPSAATEMVVTETPVAKAAQEKPKPRRVGPLRKIHVATLDRAAELSRPMLQQIVELRRQAGAIQAQAIDDVLEDLGEAKREAGEDARIVEEDGEAYVELAPAGARKVGPKA